MRSFKKFVESKKIVEYVFVPALYKGKWAVLDTVSQVYYDVQGGKDAAEKKCKELNDVHHKAPVKLDPLEEAEYNDAWWNSKSDNFKKRYIERHPNSIYAQKAKNIKSSKPKDTISVDELEGIRTKSGNINLNKLRALLGQPPLKSKNKPVVKKPAKEQPADKWVDDAFDEANLHFKWQKAKDRMSYHGIDEFTVKDIINSGQYEPEEIIDALNSSNHHKIDAMTDSIKK